MGEQQTNRRQLAEALQNTPWGSAEYDAICEEICRLDDLYEKRGRAAKLAADWLNPPLRP